MKYLRIGYLVIAVVFLNGGLFAQTQDLPPKAPGPVSYGMVVDNSGSYRTLLERVINLVKEVAKAHTENDEAFLITFVDNSKTVVRQEFTSDKDELIDAAENMYIEGGLTTLLDALRLSLDYLSANARNEADRKRSILLVTDGDDRNSAAKVETIISLAKSGKVRIVVVGMTDEKLNVKLLDRLAKETGGKAFYPKTPKEVGSIAPEVAAAIRGN